MSDGHHVMIYAVQGGPPKEAWVENVDFHSDCGVAELRMHDGSLWWVRSYDRIWVSKVLSEKPESLYGTKEL